MFLFWVFSKPLFEMIFHPQTKVIQPFESDLLQRLPPPLYLISLDIPQHVCFAF